MTAGGVRRLLFVAALTSSVPCEAALPGAPPRSSLSPLLAGLPDLGRAAPAAERHVVVGLRLRNRDALEVYLAAMHDPASPAYRRILGAQQFAATYAPMPADEEAVVAHLAASGLRITERFPNRLLVGAVGTTAAVEHAFGTELHDVALDGARRTAAVREPAMPAAIATAVAGVIGLDDLTVAHARLHRVRTLAAPQAAIGGRCCYFGPADLATFYDLPPQYDGAGQTVVIAGVYRWNDADNAVFDAEFGLPGLPAGSGQICTGAPGARGCRFDRKRSMEAALDVEYAHGLAPAARILNYMAASPSFADLTTMYERIVTDDPGHAVATSWGACEAETSAATQEIDDEIFASAEAIGQAWFAASGDAGSRDCAHGRPPRHVRSVDHPANSPHVVAVGGTTPVCRAGLTGVEPACSGYGSESGWRGSGGGVSDFFPRPASQSGCGIPDGAGRLVPDVAFAANPGNYVRERDHWFAVSGTSAAVPPWAAVWSALLEKAGDAGLGPPGPRLYALCGTPGFHDVTVGSNGDYRAGPGFDLVTGLGSPDVRALIDLSS